MPRLCKRALGSFGLIHVVAQAMRSVSDRPRRQGNGVSGMEREVLREQLMRALDEADRQEDFLVAALLSQCLALIDHREEALH